MNKFSNKVLKNLVSFPEISTLIQFFLDTGSENIEKSDDFDHCVKLLDSKTNFIKFGEQTQAISEELYISTPFFKMNNMLSG